MNRHARPPVGVPDRPDPQLWEQPGTRAILAERDIGALFGLLQRHGLSQRRIAALVGMSQSEISEIKGGRKVASYDVHLRVAEGLGIPPLYMGLAYPPPPGERAQHPPHPHPKPPAEPGCVVLRYAAAEFLDRRGAPNPEEPGRCGHDPCAARMIADLAVRLTRENSPDRPSNPLNDCESASTTSVTVLAEQGDRHYEGE